VQAKKPRIAAAYCVYHDDIWLSTSVESIYAEVEKIFFFVSFYPWHGEKSDNSSTLELIQSLPDPEHKINLIRGEWRDQVTQRNAAMSMFAAHAIEYMMVVDADEVYESSQLHKAIELIADHPEIDAWHLSWITYWKSLNYCIDPMEDYNPPIFLKVGRVKFNEFRNVVSEKEALIPSSVCVIHHLSYARSDELVKRKISSISAAPLIHKDWFEKVWKKWDSNQNLRDLHPVRPAQFKRAILTRPYQLPAILQKKVQNEALVQKSGQGPDSRLAKHSMPVRAKKK